MLVVKPYIRENAVAYARKYAFGQNSRFASFAGIGGNCTNFVSQCLYAGSCEMNYKPIFGWYFISLDDRSPSWTGVEYFYNFIIENADVGPFGRVATSDELEIGDGITDFLAVGEARSADNAVGNCRARKCLLDALCLRVRAIKNGEITIGGFFFCYSIYCNLRLAVSCHKDAGISGNRYSC